METGQADELLRQLEVDEASAFDYRVALLGLGWEYWPRFAGDIAGYYLTPRPVRWRGEERDRFSDEDLPDFADDWDAVGIVADHLQRVTGALLAFGTRADGDGGRWYAALIDPAGETAREYLHLVVAESAPRAACCLALRLAGPDALAVGAAGTPVGATVR